MKANTIVFASVAIQWSDILKIVNIKY
jgi:hypothetical protein